MPDDWESPLPEPLDCLGWVPRSLCVPHFNRRLLPPRWFERGLLPDGFTLIGIDEQTALISHGDRRWDVRGRGSVTIARSGTQSTVYRAGEQLVL